MQQYGGTDKNMNIYLQAIKKTPITNAVFYDNVFWGKLTITRD